MIYIKIIHGWVAQHFDSETGDCVQQEFIPDEQEPVVRRMTAASPSLKNSRPSWPISRRAAPWTWCSREQGFFCPVDQGVRGKIIHVPLR